MLFLLAVRTLLAPASTFPQFEVRAGKYQISISQTATKRDTYCWGYEPDIKMAASGLGVIVIYQGSSYTPSYSAYSDLSALRRVEWKINADTLVVTGEGGDAHSGYDVKWVFRDGYLVRREVRSGEFPENNYEITDYVNKPYEEE